MKQRLYACFKKLRSDPTWKRYVKGGAAFCQMHVSNADQCWHVHFHLIIEHHYFPHSELSLLWHKCTGDSDNVWLERISDIDKATREACRYVASPIDKQTAKSLPHLAEALCATKGARLCFTFGSWRGTRLHERRREEDAREWLDIDHLGAVIYRAERGDDDAKQLLHCLFASKRPERGPPTLFHKPLYLRNVDHHAMG